MALKSPLSDRRKAKGIDRVIDMIQNVSCEIIRLELSDKYNVIQAREYLSRACKTLAELANRLDPPTIVKSELNMNIKLHDRNAIATFAQHI